MPAGAATPLPAARPSALTPRAHAPVVRAWLGVIALLVLATVLVGGATRLTGSGLSIVEWRPATGVVPPLSQAGWQREFDKYRETPQFQRVNAGMSVEEFKTIYWWEWGHRLLGRLIGVVFVVPFVVFWRRGWLTRGYGVKLGSLFALGGVQGAVGWWMVTSGLVNRVEVAHDRLAVHLLIASAILAVAVRLMLELSPRPAPLAPRHRRLATLILVAVFVQIGAGALVAGLDAGLSHNTWPLMEGRVIPPLDGLAAIRPAWQNIFDNALTVQFQHRMLAYAILGLVLWQAVALMRDAPTAPAARSAIAVMALTGLQVALGVATLLLHVPPWAALLHQALAMALLVAAVWHLWRLPAMDPNATAAVSVSMSK